MIDADDPILSRATETLRAAGREARAPAGARDAIVGRVGKRRRQRKLLTTSVAVVMTLLAVPAAWAARHPGDVSRWFHRVIGSDASERSHAHHAPSAAHTTPAVRTEIPTTNIAIETSTRAETQRVSIPRPPAPTSTVPLAAPVPARSMTSPARSDPAPVAPRPVRTAVASGHGPVGSVQPRTASAATVGSAPAASSPADDADLALYRVAHEAHFVARDPSAALAAWDQYLAAQPQGRFALEARYNRAISLLRVGRRDEGLAALRVFADGTNGGYRQAEARRILDAQAPQTAPR